MSYIIIPKYLSNNEIEILTSIANSSSGWQDGRQGTGYEKLSLKDNREVSDLILRSLVELHKIDDFWDAWILRYPDGAYIPPHKDEANMFGRRHTRLNAIIADPRAGGDFILNDERVGLGSACAIIFNPDEHEHSVTKVDGERLVFTVGCWV